jgi:hypothetical protein
MSGKGIKVYALALQRRFWKMRNSDDLEDELDAIREELYEDIKDMTPSEMNAYMSAKVEPLEKKFNFKVVSEPPIRKSERKVPAQG